MNDSHRLRISSLLLLIPAFAATSAPAAGFGKDPKGPQPMCFLSGQVNSGSREKTGLGALGGMIRLRFDANTLEDCRIEFEAYCRTQLLEKHFGLKPLRGYFSDGKNNRTELIVTRTCSVERYFEERKEAEPRPRPSEEAPSPPKEQPQGD